MAIKPVLIPVAELTIDDVRHYKSGTSHYASENVFYSVVDTNLVDRNGNVTGDPIMDVCISFRQIVKVDGQWRYKGKKVHYFPVIRAEKKYDPLTCKPSYVIPENPMIEVYRGVLVSKRG